MARAPDQRAIEAKELYDKGLKLIEIAKELDVPVGTVRSWKNRQCWDNATLQKKKRNVAKKRGGQPGNKNAKGHGGTGPPGNKNAVKTGEFETLFFDTLNSEELQLAETIGLDKEQLLLQEIQLLTVREYRMLHRIEALKNAETQQLEKLCYLFYMPFFIEHVIDNTFCHRPQAENVTLVEYPSVCIPVSLFDLIAEAQVVIHYKMYV